MANTRLADILGQVRTALWVQESRRLSDPHLLAAFTANRDEGAFTAIVKRHGQMVLGVCRHILGQEQDAEDAFQATFLVLARRAHTIRGGEALSNWLYGVAYRTALRAKRDAGRRRMWERHGAQNAGSDPAREIAWREIQAVLEDEIHRLPPKYRRPFVLCFLEGKSRSEAARELQCKEGTISSRLDRARKHLQARLDRRGVSLSAALGACAVSQTAATAAMPLGLMARTAKGALLFGGKTPAIVSAKAGAMALAGHAAGQVSFSANAVSLAEGVIGAALLSKAFISALAVALVISFGSTMAFVAGRLTEPGRTEPIAQAPAATKGQLPKEIAAPKERLPEGAIARLGTARFANIGRPLALSFTREGKELVVGSWDGFLSVWDPAKKQLVKEWDSQAGLVHTLAISPDGATIAEAGRVSGIRLWRWSDGTLLATLAQLETDEQDLTESLQFSPNGKFLVASGWGWRKNENIEHHGRAVRLWELNSGKQTYVLDRPRQAGYHVPSFASNGSALMIACCDHDRGSQLAKAYVLFVAPETGRQIKRIDLPDDSVPRYFPAYENFALSPSGRWLVRVGTDPVNNARMWATDIPARRKIEVLRTDLVRQSDVLFAVAPDERCVAVTYPGQPLMVVELATGQVRWRFESPETGNVSLAFSPNGRLLASGSVDRTVLMWDLTGRSADGTLRPIKLSRNQLQGLWDDLKSADGETTQRAIWALVAGADNAVPFLGEKIKSWRSVDARRIAALIHDLGSESFQTRTKAEKELDEFHDAAEPLLRQKLAEPVTLEVRRRIEQILQRIDRWWLKQQGSRAVEVLEHIGNAEAKEVLKEVAASRASPRLAEEAKAALRRLVLTHVRH